MSYLYNFHFYDNCVISIWSLIINSYINNFIQLYNFDLQINTARINKKI